MEETEAGDRSLVNREWLITKILDASQEKYYGKLCGLVLAGGTGAGKTTFCRQVTEARPQGQLTRKQSMLQSKIIASYIIPSRRLIPGTNIVQFLHSVYSQLCDNNAVSRFQPQTDNSWLREAVDDPDEVFKRILLFPLLECEVQHKGVILLVDGLDLDACKALMLAQAQKCFFEKAEKDGTIAPQRKLANEKPKGETVDYDTLIKSWPATPPKRAEAK